MSTTTALTTGQAGRATAAQYSGTYNVCTQGFYQPQGYEGKSIKPSEN